MRFRCLIGLHKWNQKLQDIEVKAGIHKLPFTYTYMLFGEEVRICEICMIKQRNRCGSWKNTNLYTKQEKRELDLRKLLSDA